MCSLQMVQSKQKHHSEMSKITRDYEERMLTLMRQLPPVGLKESTEHKVYKIIPLLLFFYFSYENRQKMYCSKQVSEKDLMERLRIQQEELERCCSLQEKLNSALNEIDQLKQQKPLSEEMK